ncbi:ABC transporter permease [Natrinema soli]|uniref:FtsX-like permease family protein n=1 Tax=Natrinema soli TaxID=1930624 RepID=A0ABD5SSF9_9EURY|nr:ABC transporter permease [Natrinema soli]
MDYPRVLVNRWARRDWFAVLVIALTVALLVGATLLVVTAGAQTTTLAADYEANATVTSYDSVAAAHNATGPHAVVLPLATATSATGEQRTVVGVPADSPSGIDLPAQPSGAVGPDNETSTWQFEGTDGTVTRTVTPAPAAATTDLLPPTWIRTTPATLEQLGPTEALVLTPTENAATHEGTPLVSALAFFVTGTADILGIVWSGIAVAGALVAVTLSSVVRLTIRERAQTIRVLRATGATPRQIRTALALRAGLLAAAGATLGYAIGVIIPNAAINVAVAAGLPTTLSVQVTTDAVMLIGALVGALLVVGAGTGYVTARRATTQPPTHVGRTHETSHSSPWRRLDLNGIGHRLSPTILPLRTIGPTAATLSTFAVIVLLVGSLGTVGASLSTDSATVTAPDAPHPLGSQVPAEYGDTLTSQGVAASPEILLFTSYENQPYLARGVDYTAFANVTGSRIVAGTAPTAPDEAVIGSALAETLGLAPGDEVPLGGTTDTAVTQVTIVGTYTTGGLADHQLLVSLPTARHLSTVENGSVNLIRTDDAAPAATSTAESPTVVATDVPSYVQTGEPVTVNVTVWNPTDTRMESTLTTTLGSAESTHPVVLDAQERRTVTLTLDPPPVGAHTLRIDGTAHPVTVVEEPPLEITTLPATAPPNESLQIRVREATGAPAANATVTLDGQSTELTATGTAWLQTPAEPGTYPVTVQAGKRNQTQSLQITKDSQPTAIATATIAPPSPTIHTRPTVTVQLANPWNRTLETPVTINGSGTAHQETVRLEPGATRTLSTRLPHRPVGTYTVDVTAGNQPLTTTEYQVTGDERLVSALAASGYVEGGGGLGTAITYAIGNLQVLLGALVGLAVVTVIGATSLVLTRAIHARRHTFAIYRATGAAPRRLWMLILGDALRIGAVASGGAFLLACGVLKGLAALGQLTVFGISLEPQPTLPLVGAILGGGIVLTLLAAAVATVPLIRAPPATLLTESGPTPAPSTRPESAVEPAPGGDHYTPRSAEAGPQQTLPAEEDT